MIQVKKQYYSNWILQYSKYLYVTARSNRARYRHIVKVVKVLICSHVFSLSVRTLCLRYQLPTYYVLTNQICYVRRVARQ